MNSSEKNKTKRSNTLEIREMSFGNWTLAMSRRKPERSSWVLLSVQPFIHDVLLEKITNVFKPHFPYLYLPKISLGSCKNQIWQHSHSWSATADEQHQKAGNLFKCSWVPPSLNKWVILMHPEVWEPPHKTDTIWNILQHWSVVTMEKI